MKKSSSSSAHYTLQSSKAIPSDTRKRGSEEMCPRSNTDVHSHAPLAASLTLFTLAKK